MVDFRCRAVTSCIRENEAAMKPVNGLALEMVIRGTGTIGQEDQERMMNTGRHP